MIIIAFNFIGDKKDKICIIYQNLKEYHTLEEVLTNQTLTPQQMFFFLVDLLSLTFWMHKNNIYHQEDISLKDFYIDKTNFKLFFKGFSFLNTEINKDNKKIKGMLKQINDYLS